MSLGCPNRALHEMPLTTHRPWLVSICGTKFHPIVKNIIHHFPMKSAMCPIESYHFPHSNDHGFLGVNWVNSHKFPLFLGVNWVNSHKFPVFLGVNWVNSHKFPLFLGVFLPFFWDKKNRFWVPFRTSCWTSWSADPSEWLWSRCESWARKITIQNGCVDRKNSRENAGEIH